MTLRDPSRWALPAAVSALAILLFWPAGGFDYVGFDDAGHVYGNPCLFPPDIGNAWRAWSEPYVGIFMPAVFMLWSALALGAHWAYPRARSLAETPWIFHRANIVVHALNAALVCSVLIALLPAADSEKRPEPASPRRRGWAAFAGALLFAWHPLQVEPVAWVSGMKDLLCAFFSLLSLRAYLAFALGGKRAGLLYALALLAYGVALCAKPSAISLPFIKLALDAWVLRRPVGPALRWAGLWLLAALPVVALNSFLQPTRHLQVLAPLWTRPLIAGDALAFYMAKLVWPLRLGLDYGRSPRYVMDSGWGYASWILPAGACACALRRPGPYAAAAAIFAAGVLPVLGLFAFQHQRFSTVADRYTYLSMLGAALAAARLLSRARRGAAAAAAAALLLALCGSRARAQLRFWKNTAALYTRAVEVNPRSVIFQTALGDTFAGQGRAEEARRRFAAALSAQPAFLPALFGRGDLELSLGRIAEAEADYRAMLGASEPYDVALAHVRLGRAALRAGRPGSAVRHEIEALRISPRCGEALEALAEIASRQGRPERAAQYRRLAAGVKVQSDCPAPN